MANYAQEFKSLLSSPLGKEFVRELTARSAQLYDESRQADTMEKAYGLLKESSGVIKAIEHLQFLAIVPKDEGGEQ